MAMSVRVCVGVAAVVMKALQLAPCDTHSVCLRSASNSKYLRLCTQVCVSLGLTQVALSAGCVLQTVPGEKNVSSSVGRFQRHWHCTSSPLLYSETF